MGKAPSSMMCSAASAVGDRPSEKGDICGWNWLITSKVRSEFVPHLGQQSPFRRLWDALAKIHPAERTHTLLTALFGTTEAWRPPQSPLRGHWPKKPWCSHTAERPTAVNGEGNHSCVLFGMQLQSGGSGEWGPVCRKGGDK